MTDNMIHGALYTKFYMQIIMTLRYDDIIKVTARAKSEETTTV